MGLNMRTAYKKALISSLGFTVNPARFIQLNEAADGRVFHLVAEVGDNTAPQTWETLTRTGKFYHPVYGDFEITASQLNKMVSNFKKDVYGQKLFIDVEHRSDRGAAAEILQVRRSGNRLQVLLEWTTEGRDQVKNKGRRYLSIEYHENYQPNEYEENTGDRPNHGAVLTGGGLVLKPHVKGMPAIDPHALAEHQDDNIHHYVLHPTLKNKLLQENIMNFAQIRAALLVSLGALSLSEKQSSALLSQWDKLASAEDLAMAQKLADGFADAGKQLGEAEPGSIPNISVSVSGASEGDINAAVTKALAAAETGRQLAATAATDTVTKLTEKYTATINASKVLSEVQKTAIIAKGTNVIGANFTEAQVVNMATVQLGQAEEMAAALKLSEDGFMGQGVQGAVTINKNAVALGERIHAITIGKLRETESFADGDLKLTEHKDLHMFTKKVLAQFDTVNAVKLQAEEKALSDGTLSDTQIPMSVQRQVITEVVDDLKILELVNTVVDAKSTTTGQYPYEKRDKGPLQNFGIVAEGQGIPTSGVQIKLAEVKLVARKLAMKLSNELIHFNAGSVNWDSWARTISANTQLMREELARWITHELQRTSDALAAVGVTDENIAARMDGSNSMIVLAKFPLVAAFQRQDMQGNNVDAEENPIVLKLNSVPIAPYPVGAKTIAANTYYIVNSYNLGLISLIDESGNPITPTESTATVSYTHATNVELFDMDFDAAKTDKPKHLKGLVNLIGRVRDRMYMDVGVEPNFGLSAATLHGEITEADNFTSQGEQKGTATNMRGDLEKIKGIPMYRTNTGSSMGEERLQLGVRGTTAFVLNKPFTAAGSSLIECVNGDGLPTGEKMAYGEEYSGIDTPVVNRDRYKAIIAYSAAARAAL